MENPNKQPKLDREVRIWPFWLLVFTIPILCVAFGAAVICLIDDWGERGQFGDMFGGLNALFSGAAFAGVVYAIILQRRELALQREEMRMSREELAAQNQLITAQLKTMNESFDFERNIETRSSEPYFRSTGGGNNANRKYIRMENLGGRITELTVDVQAPDSGISVNIIPDDVWDTGAKGQVEIVGFGGEQCPPCKCVLHYTDRLGRQRSLPFRIPGGSCTFEPIETEA